MSLRKYTYRAMQQRPGRTILTLLSIVIGVTAAVAIGLGTATTRNAYKQMFELVTGRATLEIDGLGGKSFKGELLDEVLKVPGVQAASPLLQRKRPMTIGEEQKIYLEVLGVDPARDKQVRDYDIVEGRMIKDGDELALEKEFAAYFGLKVGEEVRITVNSGARKTFVIVGTFSPRTGASFTQMAMTLMPIDRAQRHFNSSRVPKTAIDRIQIVTAPSADIDAMEAKIAAILPENVQVHRPAASTQLMRNTLLSAEQGLRTATFFSLLMAAFIILNTFLMNVSERRRHLSIMRAIGATKWQIGWSLLGESMLLGVVGTSIGMGAGVAVAWGATFVVARAFQVQLPRLVEVMTPTPFIVGALFGMIMCLIGTVVPAIMAGRVSPLEGMNRIVPPRSRNLTALMLITGIVLVALSTWAIVESIFGRIRIDLVMYFGVMFLIGVVLIDSVFLGPQAAFIAGIVRLLFRVEAALALKQIMRNRMRSALTVAVLFIAGSTGLAIASSILDNVYDVKDWSRQALPFDYVIRAMMPDMATGTAPDLPDALGEELAKVSHVQFLEAASFIQARVMVNTADPADAVTAIVVARKFVNPDPPFDLISGDFKKLRSQLFEGQVVVGSVLAQKYGYKLGDKIPLETSEGVVQVPICGIANEYLAGGMSVHMYRVQAEKWLGIEGVDGYSVNAEPGHRDELQPVLDKIAKKYGAVLLSEGQMRKNIDKIVGGVQWSLWVLVLLGFVVAAFGVVNTLTMNVLEQTRELGLLRIVAMTKAQVRRTIFTQALIIGGVGLPPGIAMGVLVAYAMNLVMMPSFGHPIEFQLHPQLLVLTLAGSLAIVLIAAILPALRATRINVVEALHYE